MSTDMDSSVPPMYINDGAEVYRLGERELLDGVKAVEIQVREAARQMERMRQDRRLFVFYRA